jgi:hypothetical protein
MSNFEIAFLSLVVGAFTIFMATLALVAWWTERTPRAPMSNERASHAVSGAKASAVH